MTASAVVLVMCGLPGAGKSSFCRALAARCEVDDTVAIEWVCYDDIFEASRHHENPFDPSAWRDLRLAVVDRVRSRLHELSCPTDATNKFLHVILLDDNMYYRSMRKRFHQLAQAHCAGFGQVSITTPADTCRQRNQARPVPVPESVFKRMASLLEVPDANAYPWESHTLQLPLETDAQRNDAINRTIEFVKFVAQHPESKAPSVDLHEQEASRESNRRSAVHCLDTRLRRLVGTILRDEDSKVVMAKVLNSAKDVVLDQCRQARHHDAVEATVDEFVACFLHLVEDSCQISNASPRPLTQ